MKLGVKSDGIFAHGLQSRWSDSLRGHVSVEHFGVSARPCVRVDSRGRRGVEFAGETASFATARTDLGQRMMELGRSDRLGSASEGSDRAPRGGCRSHRIAE